MKKDREEKELAPSKVGFVSNFPPKECGIATFTKDLTNAMDKRFNPRLKSRVIALNEESSFYNYGKEVIFQINKDDLEDWISKARQINNSEKIKLVCIQHEFGLFGGDYGSYIIPFLETIEKPVVTTFHSILPEPDEIRKRIVKFICSKSEAIIVMAQKAVEILEKDYEIEPTKIHVVHHGIPDVSFSSQEKFKKHLSLDGKIVLSTFGLLSRGKGIEHMIRALPSLIEKYPNLLYLVIGETHPIIRKKEGETYRNQLMEEIKRLGLQEHVKFYNKYVTLTELLQYLNATDIYICTNLEKNQITSGTLAYALGCGRAVISTPFIYAKEILAEERGEIVKLKNPKSYSQAIDKILSNKEYKENLEKNAYDFGRKMIWSNVASEYLKIFNNIVKLREETVEKFPPIKLNHLRTLTDGFGVIQFAKHSTPDKTSGYTVDDNARALIAAVSYNHLFDSSVSEKLIEIYLTFLKYSQNKKGMFNNIIHEDKVINDSEDAFGRALWALGYTMKNTSNQKILEKSKKLFDKSFKLTNKLRYLRAKAFSIFGLYYYYKKYPQERIKDRALKLADSLIKAYEKESSKDWHWFEEQLSYANSKLPEAMFFSYALTKNKRYLEIAEKSLKFLSDMVFIEEKLSPIGQNGWFKRNGTRAFYDQQPIDASAMVQTFLTAYLLTKKEEYYKKAVIAFNWFLGKNHLKQMVYNETTGGCYDGLSENSLNLNQGAESTISYLTARLFLEEIKRAMKK